MSFWQQYKSPLGYTNNNNNQIDSYGVDHSGFNTQDELQYQNARINREKNLMTQMNNQGIITYPQYSTNFWGNNPDNNYGFGTSNISNNIESMKQVSQNLPSISSQPANNYLVPQEAYTDASWGQETAKKLDNYMQNYNSYPGKTRTGILATFHDMSRNYKTMRDEQNWIGSDNFFHCKANYEAAKRGPWGELAGKAISAGREILGQLTGDALSDMHKDWHANRMGWQGAKQGLTLEEACPTNPKAYVNPKDYNNIF